MKKIFYGDNENQFGELRLPDGEGPHPAAIILHGGFWRKEYGLELMTAIAEDLTDAGWATWNVEYRRVGQEGGAWPGTFRDAANACDYVAELADSYSLDLKQVITIGHSAGGHLALWLAARHRLPEDSELFTTNNPLPIAHAVSLAGVNDLQTMYHVHHFRDQAILQTSENPVADLLKVTPEEFPRKFQETSPFELLPFGVPQLIVHGSLDVNVPAGISDQYYQLAEETGETIKYVKLPQAEHFMLIDTKTEAWAEVREELELLRKNL